MKMSKKTFLNASEDSSKLPKTKTDLTFLGSHSFKRLSRKGWTIEKAVEFVGALRELLSDESRKMTMGEAFKIIAKRTSMSVSGCSIFWQEINKAFKNGYESLEEYYEKGREFQPSKIILAKKSGENKNG